MMITFLDGKLEEKQSTRVVMNLGGIGYEVLVPLSSFDRLPSEGDLCRILIYHHITDVSQVLFGFCTEEEREMFKLLLGVSGIGPKTAISALSGLSVQELKIALMESDVRCISSISGIGKKTAERVVVELRDKFSGDTALDTVSAGSGLSGDHRLRDAMFALIALGYKQAVAQKMVNSYALKLEDSTTVEEIVRRTLTG